MRLEEKIQAGIWIKSLFLGNHLVRLSLELCMMSGFGRTAAGHETLATSSRLGWFKMLNGGSRYWNLVQFVSMGPFMPVH